MRNMKLKVCGEGLARYLAVIQGFETTIQSRKASI